MNADEFVRNVINRYDSISLDNIIAHYSSNRTTYNINTIINAYKNYIVCNNIASREVIEAIFDVMNMLAERNFLQYDYLKEFILMGLYSTLHNRIKTHKHATRRNDRSSLPMIAYIENINIKKLNTIGRLFKVLKSNKDIELAIEIIKTADYYRYHAR